MAGHSHAANVAIRKGKQDRLRAKTFSKLSKNIMIAARDGADPDMNFGLRHAIEKAKAQSMPKDKIEHAVKRGAGLLEGQNLTDAIYEGYAAGGVAIVVEALTDNSNRTVPQIRTIFDSAGGKFAESNSVLWMFKKKGVFRFPAEGNTEDGMTELALEAGADDVAQVGEEFEITSAPTDFEAVKKALNEGEVKPDSSQLGYKPDNEIEVDEETAIKIFKLVDNLEEHEDVSTVYTNMKWDDKVKAAHEKFTKENS